MQYNTYSTCASHLLNVLHLHNIDPIGMSWVNASRPDPALMLGTFSFDRGDTAPY